MSKIKLFIHIILGCTEVSALKAYLFWKLHVGMVSAMSNNLGVEWCFADNKRDLLNMLLTIERYKKVQPWT